MTPKNLFFWLTIFLLVLVTGCSAQPALTNELSSSGVQTAQIPTAASPNPTEETNGVNIVSAVEQGLVEIVEARGFDIARLDLVLKSNAHEVIEVQIPAGVLFSPQNNGAVQTMVVRRPSTAALQPGEKNALALTVSCANMHQDAPSEETTFTLLGASHPDSDMVKLLNNPAFADLKYADQQFAIWTITDNPASDEYVGISGPDSNAYVNEAVLHTIHDIFVSSGIDVTNYQATVMIAREEQDSQLLTTGDREERVTPAFFAVSPDGKVIAVNGDAAYENGDLNNKLTQLWSATDNSIIQTMRFPGVRLGREIEFSSDGTKLAVLFFGEEEWAILNIWDMPSNSLDKTIHACSRTLVYHLTSMRLAEVCDTSIKILDLTTGSEIKSFSIDQWVSTISLSADGKVAAILGQDMLVSIWSTETGVKLQTMKTPHPMGNALVELSPDGSFLFYQTENAPLALWDTRTGEQASPDFRPTEELTWLRTATFSSDGQYCAFTIGGVDGISTLLLYDIPNKNIIGKLTYRGSDFSRPQFSSDGQAIYILEDDAIKRVEISALQTP